MPRAASSTYRNSRVGRPVPQAVRVGAPASRASMHLRMMAGMTCEPAGSKSSAESYLGDIGAFREYVEKQGSAIDFMKEAAAYEQCSFPIVHTWEREGKPVSSYIDVGAQLARVRDMVRTLSDAAFAAEASGDTMAAAELGVTCLRMGKHVARGHALCTLVGIACTSVGIDTLDRVVANNELPDVVLRDIILKAQRAELLRADLRKCLEIDET